METVRIGNITVSRFLLGGNPFSGFSHQSPERNMEMIRYYTTTRIKQTLAEAERVGITGAVLRADHHIARVLLEYADEGGKLQWFAQTCPELGNEEATLRRAAQYGAKACHIHGGVMEYSLAHGRGDEIRREIDRIREHGMLAGVAGHQVSVFDWAEENIEADYYMCCYYNPSRRDENPEHVSGSTETFAEEDREAMTSRIRTLSRPVIHYKVLGAGRNDPAQAFAYCRAKMRPDDMVCVGVYLGDNPNMLQEDVQLFEQAAGSNDA